MLADGGALNEERSDGWLRAGIIGAPHGLDGSFHVAQANPVLLDLGRTVRIGDQVRTIDRRAGHAGRLILRVEGCSNRDAAATFRGQSVFALRDDAPGLEADEWWAEDLEGCEVWDGERHVGAVRRLLALPSCEILEVTRSGEKDLLVPLVADAVRDVDLERGRIDVDLAFLGEP